MSLSRSSSSSSTSSTSSRSSKYEVVRGDLAVSGDEVIASFVVNDELFMFPFTSVDPSHTEAVLSYDTDLNLSEMQRFEARFDNGTVAIQLNGGSHIVMGMKRSPSRKAERVRTEVGWMKGIPASLVRQLCFYYGLTEVIA